MAPPKYVHLHLVSDATGETIITIARATFAQFSAVSPIEHIYPLVRDNKQLERVLAEIEVSPGLVFYAMLDQTLGASLEAKCKELDIPCHSILKPTLDVADAWIKGLAREQVPAMPQQGVGPHFEISDNGVITFAPSQALDRKGNNVARLKGLHPSLRALSLGLTSSLGKGNIPHWHLRNRAEAYAALVDQDLEHIDLALLYVEGVRLANAKNAADEKIAEKELPSLETPVREAIDTLLQVHSSFIMATAEGIEAIAEEERYTRTPLEEIGYRAASIEFAKALQNMPDVIDNKAASFALSTVEEIGGGTHRERSGVVATGTIKNIAITVSTAATLAALSTAAIASASPALIVGAGASVLVIGEGLKRSKSFAAAAALVTKGLDGVSDTEIRKILRNLKEKLNAQLRFVLAVEPQLRNLANQRGQFDWLNRSLDWIKRQMPDDR